MRKHIIAQSVYQLFWLFFFMYGLPVMFPTRYGFTDRCEFFDRDAGAMCAKAAVEKWAAGAWPPAAAVRPATPCPAQGRGAKRGAKNGPGFLACCRS
jgi:hypothetical protein